jgi:ribosomal protein S18 acetylase RimI-like enzyme
LITYGGMTNILNDITIRQLDESESIPYTLLLDADPSMEAIDRYLHSSEIYVGLLADKIIATFVLHQNDKDTLEIKNIAVEEKFQNKGIGKLLLNYASQMAAGKSVTRLVIGTSNASIAQLYLYQNAGFEITGIKHNFFLDNYPEPIFENSIQCKHMIMLTKQL